MPFGFGDRIGRDARRDLARRHGAVERPRDQLAFLDRHLDGEPHRAARFVAPQRERPSLPRAPRVLTDSGVTLRICRQRSSTCGAVASSAYASSKSSSCRCATRVSARTFEYDSRPSANAAAIAGSARSACAVRTFSRAADSDSRSATRATRRSS